MAAYFTHYLSACDGNCMSHEHNTQNWQQQQQTAYVQQEALIGGIWFDIPSSEC